ncbi:nickel-binding protein [Pseudonocardia kunmingensis]|uniref:Uncharacterized protein DUF4242 n=1 Tax=Pseudonocardia kunmingensis TaxID=630975 RepID=A0A543DR21_9PSEU|nr:nickel-binding protein [Pseudonocardia kunmingensis]TQM11739.1 uncharacterized protein DUF4242 [Pseudonocardia kunmingensis]
MPRYSIERALPEDLGAFLVERPVSEIVLANTELGVAWLCCFVNSGDKRLFCMYEPANPEAIRKAGRRTGLPIEVIHRVTVLEPHAFADRGAWRDPTTAQEEPPTAAAAAGWSGAH